MIKRILLLLAVCLLPPCLAFAADDANLLVNPGFETLSENGMPSGWFTDAYIKREGISQFSVAKDAYAGEYAVLIENFDENDARFAQTVQVEPNAMYRLSGWIKAMQILDAGHGANLSIEDVYVFSDSLYETGGEWVYVETYGLTGEDQTELTVFARVGGYSGESEGAAAFDELSLVRVDDLPSGVFADAWYMVETVQNENPVSSSETKAAAAFWPWLIFIGCVYAAVAGWLMRHTQLDRCEEARYELENAAKRTASVPLFVVLSLAVAAILRMGIALSVEGYQVDVNCFTAWGYTMADVGPADFYQSNWCDYTPGYIYVMGLNGLIANLLNGFVSPAFIHKFIPMACDLLGALLLYRLATEHQYNRIQAGLLAMIFAFNPATILNSAAWCQIDSVLCVGLMCVAYFAMHRRWAFVLPMYVLCILIKPQALMLGFLGLAAIIMEVARIPEPKNKSGKSLCVKSQRSSILRMLSSALHWLWVRRSSKVIKELGIGLIISVILTLAIVLPFSPNQESPTWLIDQYASTLNSYNHATVNTANIYYLAGANWAELSSPADIGVVAFFFILSILWGIYTALHQRNSRKLWFIEPGIMLVYAIAYLVQMIRGCTWADLGWLTMSMAFALILPQFIRSGKMENLPICGAAIFLLLYVFGIKMHERYLFPAIFLLGMAYAIRRDRRIFALLIGASCVLFVNEGIVLDNSIRLGSVMGHLNADTTLLANGLSVLNVAFALFSLWTCYRICVADPSVRLSASLGSPVLPVKKYVERPCSPLSFQTSAKLTFNRLDALLMLIVTMIYAIVTLTTLGSTKAPQTAWKSTAKDEYVYIDLGRHYDEFSMLYFCQVSYSNFAVSVSDDIASSDWSESYPAQMAEGQCFQWKYLKPSYMSDGSPTFVDATSFDRVQKLSGRFVRIEPKQVGLVINELIFKDAAGNIITGASIVRRDNGNPTSSLYSNTENLLDEQSSLEGEPSWWNSTYFDEIYHARTAFEHLNQANAYEWTHPPLGKILMSWFIGLFGMTPFGWRFAGALCGILMLPAMYLLVKQLTKRTDMAFLAMMLMALDCMHFTQTRLATIDSYPVLFIMLSYFFMLRFMQRDIVVEDIRSILPDLACSGFFMGCGVASKWIGVYAGIGLAVLYFWTCLRHFRLSRLSAGVSINEECPNEASQLLHQRVSSTFRRILVLCLWCLLFFVMVPVLIYLLSYTVHFADRSFDSIWDFLKAVYNTNFGKYNSMISYHSTPGLGMDHYFYSPWYEWPLMITPMYYASASFTPDGKTYAIFCFGNPWVWLVGLAGIAYTLYRWLSGHRYQIAGQETTAHLYRDDWDIAPAFILIGLLAQFLPWVLVPRGTYIYHYFASVPFLILGTTLLFDHFTKQRPRLGKRCWIIYLVLCLVWFLLLFPYASGMMTPNAWMDFIRDYPYINLIPDYWQHEWLVDLHALLEKLPILPNVYHH